MSLGEKIADQKTQWRQFCTHILAADPADPEPLVIEVGTINKFVQFLRMHGLETLLIDKLEQQCRIKALPEFVTSELAEIRRRTYVREIYRKQQLIKLLNLLTQSHFEYLLLKGTALAYSIYQQPYQRPRLDTDILIDIDDRQDIDKLLIDNGYSKSTNISGQLISHQNTYRKIHHHGIHAYDIHWKISNSNAYADRFDFHQLYAEKTELPSLNGNACCLDPINAFLHGTVHYFGHLSDERDRLIWLYDLHLLTESFSHQDWKLLLKRSREKQLDPLVKQILLIIRKELKTIIPDNILALLEESGIKLHKIEHKRLSTKNWSRIDQFKSDWAALNFKQRIRFIKEFLLPPSDFMLRQNSSNNRILLPYFYLKRILLGVIKIIQQ